MCSRRCTACPGTPAQALAIPGTRGRGRGDRATELRRRCALVCQHSPVMKQCRLAQRRGCSRKRGSQWPLLPLLLTSGRTLSPCKNSDCCAGAAYAKGSSCLMHSITGVCSCQMLLTGCAMEQNCSCSERPPTTKQRSLRRLSTSCRRERSIQQLQQQKQLIK